MSETPESEGAATRKGRAIQRGIIVRQAIKWLYGDRHSECQTVGQFRNKMRRQFGCCFEHLITDWPEGYDMTSFLRGDDPRNPDFASQPADATKPS